MFYGALDQGGIWTITGRQDEGLTSLRAAHALGRLRGPILDLFAYDSSEALDEFLEVRIWGTKRGGEERSGCRSWASKEILRVGNMLLLQASAIGVATANLQHDRAQTQK